MRSLEQGKRGTIGILVAALILGGLGWASYFTIGTAMFAFSVVEPNSKKQVVIEIQKGLTPMEISLLLESENIIQSSRDFITLGKLTRQWRRIKAGEYKVSPSMTPIEVFSVITSGVSLIHPITVREGENIFEIAQDIENKNLGSKTSFLALCRNPVFIASLGLGKPSPSSLEGYLFPETYFFNRTMTQEEMVRQMVRRFLSLWTSEDEARARALGMTRHQVITLASIVEKETGAAGERPMISSVFHNRLKKRMRLQSDPTTIYGIWETYKGNIHRSDLMAHNPFNTYVIPALPMGPISNPGREAIRAALHPAESPYLFFVSHNDGTHEFTLTFREHTSAVRKFQLDPKARHGKSWRDLKRSVRSLGSGSSGQD